MIPPVPTRRLGWLAAAGGLLLLAAPALRAQETPPAQPASPAPAKPAPDAGGESAAALAFRYKIGNVQRFRSETSGNLTVTPEGGGAGLGPIPMGMRIKTVYSEKVIGTNKGTGTISTQVVAMDMAYDVFGTVREMRYANGKTVNLVNNQPAPAGNGAPMTKTAEQLRKPVVTRRDPQGNVNMGSRADPSAPVSTGSELFGSNVTVMTLPDHPVKVGDQWESTQRMTPNIPVGNGGASAVPVIEVKMTHTLKSLVSRNGHVYALVDSTGSGASPEGAPGGAINESFTGTTRFDVQRGAVASGKYNVEIALKLPIATLGVTPPPAAPGSPAAAQIPQSVRIDGSMQMILTEAPPAKPAAKGAARKRRR